MDDLYDVAVRFREAIGKTLNDGCVARIWLLHDFPDGCCTYASDLLQRYLINRCVYTRNVAGVFRREDGDSESHSWLETEDGTVIDITIDQYRYKDLPVRRDGQVYVGVRDEFHKLFEPVVITDYCSENDPLGNTPEQKAFDEFYEAVVAHMEG